jgi:uncharacterized protein (TIGR02118 family)
MCAEDEASFAHHFVPTTSLPSHLLWSLSAAFPDRGAESWRHWILPSAPPPRHRRTASTRCIFLASYTTSASYPFTTQIIYESVRSTTTSKPSSCLLTLTSSVSPLPDARLRPSVSHPPSTTSDSATDPNESDATFDMSYYLKTHMPLVEKNWKQYGLQAWHVVQYGPGPDGSKPPYSVCAVLTWGSQEDIKKATASEEAKEVFGDVANFSNKGPTFIMGDVVGASS